jgi:hypothetical protein
MAFNEDFDTAFDAMVCAIGLLHESLGVINSLPEARDRARFAAVLAILYDLAIDDSGLTLDQLTELTGLDPKLIRVQ